MALHSTYRQVVLPALLASMAPGSWAWAADSLPRRLYRVTTETGMPHLEENLRYLVTHETLCLAHEELFVAFPVLQQTSLEGCKLGHEQRHDEVISYVLVCTGHPTTGKAQWKLGEYRITGTLEVKLGGKNMTFHQRVTAVPVGECSPGAR